MKKLLLGLALLTSVSAFATVDSNTSVYILVQHVQTEEFIIQKAPIIGCFGPEKGPELKQLTAEYKVQASIGCGMEGEGFYENINALSCGKVTRAEESPKYDTFPEIDLDISSCLEKNNPDFISGIKKVVKLNFATRSVPNPKLNLTK